MESSVESGSLQLFEDIFAKTLLLWPPSLAGSQATKASWLSILKVQGRHFLKLANTWCQAVYIKVELCFKRYSYEPR